MISIRVEYAYPLAQCEHDGARCEYPDGSRQCWRCWREEHAYSVRIGEALQVLTAPRCECGTVIRAEGRDRCYYCRVIRTGTSIPKAGRR